MMTVDTMQLLTRCRQGDSLAIETLVRTYTPLVHRLALSMLDDPAEADEAAMMSQADVEAALKAGLEAMAQAIGDSLKIKIDVRSGEEIEEPEMEAGDMEMAPEMGEEELMERVLKRVAARLVKESKKRK